MTQYVLLLRQPAGSLCTAPEFFRPTIPADISALYLTGCGLHLPQGICCRVTVKLHQKRHVSALHQPGASL
ncbi:hypothetical protein QNC52_004367 [Salmonella enterica]|nr:hypothetical protein [Salmonella enterica]EJP5978586.1 hypothetical protein [Salmonella enterica]ELV7962594.1 hypothetical protein [Salmonella enterica]ELY9679908.1 hypothetical protein [Salmonella enterica]